MALTDELSQRFDISSNLGDLQSNVGSAMTDMDNVSVPDLANEFNQTSNLTSNIDLSLITQSLNEVLTQISPALANLPVANDAFEPIENILELTEQLSALDWPNALSGFESEIQTQLSGNGDFLSKLSEFSQLLQGNSGLEAVKSLVESLAQLTGANIRKEDLQLPGLTPAVQSITQLVGHLMAIWHQLSQANQLSRVIEQQLNAESITAGVEQVERQMRVLDGDTLVSLLNNLDINDTEAVAQAKQGLQNATHAVVSLRDAIAQGMGFGEATLVQLNPNLLRQAIHAASGELAQLDLSPFNQLMQGMADKLQPLFAIDLNSAPAETLDSWLTRLEARVSDVADGISSFDISTVTAPITNGIETVMSIPEEITNALVTVKLSVKQGLDAIENAIRAIPIESIANTIREVLQPIADALAFIGNLIGQIQAALETALQTLQSALDTVEIGVDSVKDAIESVFQQAKSYVDSLNLDQVIGDVSEQIENFAQLLSQADMSPFFDSVVDVIDTTTDVVDKVPFDMLPDSMEQDVVDLVQPIKAVDLNAFNNDIKNLLQLGPDGTFNLRPDLEAVLAGIQEKYDEILEVIRQADPKVLLADIDSELSNVQQQIQQLTPTVALEPVQQAIDEIKSAVGDFDLDATLAPVNEGFDELLAKVDEYKPSVVLQPMEDKLSEVRSTLFDSLQLDRWEEQLLQMRNQAVELLDPLDPTQLQPAIQELIDDLKAQSNSVSQLELGYLIGSFINGILGGANARADSFQEILNWLTNNNGTAVLTQLASSAAGAITQAKNAVQQVNPSAIVSQLQPSISAIHSAVAALPDGEIKDELQASVKALELEQAIGGFANHQQRYLTALNQANGVFTELANEGLSEVDLAINNLRDAFNPLAFAREFFQQLLAALGIGELERGLQQIVDDTFEVASAERLANILTPLLTAAKGRVADLLDGFINPVLAGIDDLQLLKDQLSLADLMLELDEIHLAARQKVEALHPQTLLGEVVSSFNDTQAEVLNFDPLGPITEGITSLQESSTRVLGKLSAQEILSTPIAIYEDVLSLLESLDLGELLTPILDVLDTLAAKVANGLDETTGSFQRLQEALPDQVGSSSTQGSVSLGG